MKIGAHVSIAASFDKSIDRITQIDGNCLQTFASSPRSLKFSPYPDEIIQKYLEKKSEANNLDHFFHGVYLINLATEKNEYLKVCVDSLINYQKLANQINARGTIFHIGSHKGKGFENVKPQIVEALENILVNTPDGVTLYLENAAGHTGVIGDKFEDLASLRESISSNELRSKLKFCLDTQHAYASGHDLSSAEKLETMLQKIDNSLGLDNIEVIHLNDSKTELNSRRDRHENIGEGHIGNKGFQNIVNHHFIKKLPLILEVPGDGKSGPRKKDIEKLKLLIL